MGQADARNRVGPRAAARQCEPQSPFAAARNATASSVALRCAVIAIVLAACAPTRSQVPDAVAPSASDAATAAHYGPAEQCPVRGEVAHWKADYCMAQIGTDDIIAAGPCLERKVEIHFLSACSARIYYKTRMCELALANGVRKGSVRDCVSDPAFVGRTVRNGGA